MKKLILTSAVLCLFLMARSQDVGASSALGSSLNNYDSYSWTNDIDQIPADKVFLGANGIVVYNNNSTRSMIKDAIMYELDANGYHQQYYDYDMLIQFLVTEQPGELITMEGYHVINGGLDTVRTEDHIETVAIEPGTLLINITDAETNKMLWQGYASGILKADMINSESKVREAVSSIFDEFDYKAKKNGSK